MRARTYQVSFVDRSSKPFLYSVRTINLGKRPGTVLDRKFYASSLRPSENPYTTFTPVEKVLETSTDSKGAKKYLVKYLHYPGTVLYINNGTFPIVSLLLDPEWVTEDNFVKHNSTRS